MKASRVGRLHGKRALAGGLVCALLTSGCVRYEILHYTPLNWDLDGRSELHISSYASTFPSETKQLPFLYKTVRTPESVYFQVFVRDARTKAGPNPHIQSLTIRSVSYRRAGGPVVTLLDNHGENFWMQNQVAPGEISPPPVACTVGDSISVSVSLHLNGKDYERHGTSTCEERTRSGLLLRDVMAR